jgi:hypothetical protein
MNSLFLYLICNRVFGTKEERQAYEVYAPSPDNVYDTLLVRLTFFHLKIFHIDTFSENSRTEETWLLVSFVCFTDKS